MSFDQLGLKKELLQAVAEQGYKNPTPVQQQAIPVILQNKDILAGAQTGTGKTAGFTLPILQLLSQNPVKGKKYVRALVLTPTRELAAQVGESVAVYGKNLSDIHSAVVFGGVNINPQIKKLSRGTDIVVATPGRLLDHHKQGNVDLSRVEIFVLDEADRMLDMGFIHDIRKIIAILPKQKQTLFFSATFSDEISKLAKTILHNPVSIEVTRRNTAAETVNQAIYMVDQKKKRDLLSWLVGSNNWKQVLVFTRTKHGANRLAGQLEKDGLKTAAIHGNKSQGARTRALADFKAGKVTVLVATDIAARGLDIDQLPHVVNFELPNVPEDYVHRIGRTGRAGNEGEAISLVGPEEKGYLRDIERLLSKKLPVREIEGYEPVVRNEAVKNNRKPAPKKKAQKREYQGSGGGGSREKPSGKRAAHKKGQNNQGNRKSHDRSDAQDSEKKVEKPKRSFFGIKW